MDIKTRIDDSVVNCIDYITIQKYIKHGTMYPVVRHLAPDSSVNILVRSIHVRLQTMMYLIFFPGMPSGSFTFTGDGAR